MILQLCIDEEMPQDDPTAKRIVPQLHAASHKLQFGVLQSFAREILGYPAFHPALNDMGADADDVGAPPRASGSDLSFSDHRASV